MARKSSWLLRLPAEKASRSEMVFAVDIIVTAG